MPHIPHLKRSWGGVRQQHRELIPLAHIGSPMPNALNSVGIFANGRSYGDVCLNEGGELLLTRGLDRFIEFDAQTGVLRAQAGMLLAEVLAFTVPQGWFMPVTPGTQFVTLGGAVANDVHGKNHHVRGAFGHHVRALQLLRSDGRLVCSPDANRDWFSATVGGLGLTGVIEWVEIQLRPIANPWIMAHWRRFGSLAEFFEQNRAWEQKTEYTVAWVDCLGKNQALGRGIYLAGDHAEPGAVGRLGRASSIPFPFETPFSLVNALSLRAFNALYYHMPRPRQAVIPYQSFFYPLDRVLNWNRMYGRRGFLQYQCVVPPQYAQDAVKDLLQVISRAKQGSFLAVLKTFGDQSSLGMLSFARPGATLALDFPLRGTPTLALMHELDAVVMAAGGAVYPAKDARMPGTVFKRGFPRWEAFTEYKDPAFSSSFWRRVTA